MSGRVTSDLLLVGSMPVETTDDALRLGGELFGDLAFALPDGETGQREEWVGYEGHTLVRPHADVELVADPPLGWPRNIYEMSTFALRGGVERVRWDAWPRIDEAIASYGIFRDLRDQGTIPAGLRFQVCLPFPESAMSGFAPRFAHDYPIVADAFEDLVVREIARLVEAVGAENLAIQWDCAYETHDIERVLPYTDEHAWERFAGPVGRLARTIPADVLVGYHICYGAYPVWPIYEAQDMDVSVRMANLAVAESGRPIDWLHLSGPRYLRSEDPRFYRPLADLDVGDARVYMGIVQPVDGVEGLRKRHAMTARYLDDFGIAMYCGIAPQPGKSGEEVLREHRDTVRAVLGERP